MRSLVTPAGRLQIGSIEAIFRSMIGLIDGAALKVADRLVRVGLSGGSTPKAFYKWALQQSAFSESLLQRILWSTSDERCVPLSSSESNFGNLDRDLLSSLHVPASQKFPWPVDLPPAQAATQFNKEWSARFGESAGFDVCFLGLGEDGHTASLFPNCPLIGEKGLSSFAATLWPERGWRLTITETGLEKAGMVVVLATGASKAAVLKSILQGPFDCHQYPAQILQSFAEKTVWLLDDAAAASL